MAGTGGFNHPSPPVPDLKAELEAFQEFCEILQREQESLVQGDVDRLLALAQLKSEKVLLLTQLSDARSRFLVSNNLSPDQQGMEALIASNRLPGLGDDASMIWRKLLGMAQRAQQLNEANGIMIETKLRHNHQALAVLQSAANQATLYGPDGKTHSTGTGRPLGKV